ncbi:hypothetical protein [Cryptosporangium aurantiacum]|uniref:Uncharacterized protein n=1 Tax=Cryptosporangium aurantiacum TaxID=134849 RepID=A0A1M7QS51_9ACTN|nr:hypothetical protein [Cryptosporangium aurantiacum]SHN34579.1 hypothetical protein SAMN05443668_105282 [Cryptosporangium aurantiacum]
MVLALLLDFANIAGGLLLAAVLLQRLPKVGSDLGLAARAAAPYGWLVGLVALVTAGYYLLVHLTDGPRVFHFEIVGLGVGVALLWDRLRGRSGPGRSPARTNGPPGATRTEPAVRAPTGAALLLAVFGIIAVIVGFQGLLTPDY